MIQGESRTLEMKRGEGDGARLSGAAVDARRRYDKHWQTLRVWCTLVTQVVPTGNYSVLEMRNIITTCPMDKCRTMPAMKILFTGKCAIMKPRTIRIHPTPVHINQKEEMRQFPTHLASSIISIAAPNHSPPSVCADHASGDLHFDHYPRHLQSCAQRAGLVLWR